MKESREEAKRLKDAKEGLQKKLAELGKKNEKVGKDHDKTVKGNATIANTLHTYTIYILYVSFFVVHVCTISTYPHGMGLLHVHPVLFVQ